MSTPDEQQDQQNRPPHAEREAEYERREQRRATEDEVPESGDEKR